MFASYIYIPWEIVNIQHLGCAPLLFSVTFYTELKRLPLFPCFGEWKARIERTLGGGDSQVCCSKCILSQILKKSLSHFHTQPKYMYVNSLLCCWLLIMADWNTSSQDMYFVSPSVNSNEYVKKDIALIFEGAGWEQQGYVVCPTFTLSSSELSTELTCPALRS